MDKVVLSGKLSGVCSPDVADDVAKAENCGSVA
jgi:hypothetical protein